MTDWMVILWVDMSASKGYTIIVTKEKKKGKITHPFLKEKMEWGLVPYAQALLLARYLRDDLDGYPPFLWK